MRQLAPSFSTLHQLYLATIKAKGYQLNQRQVQVINILQDFQYKVESAKPVQNPQPDSQNTLKGIYLYGGPGCGKTFLLNLLYSNLSIKQKGWRHFNNFMQQLDSEVHAIGKSGDQMATVAAKLCQQYRVIFLDQFQVTHISHAMLLKRVFEKALVQQLTLVASSNRPPSDLYKDGLMRDRFLPFIPFIQKQCQVIDMDSDVDFRVLFQKHKQLQTYIHPLTKADQAYKYFQHLAQGVSETPFDLFVPPGRILKLQKTAAKMLYASFSELCQQKLGPNDYIALAKTFSHVFLVGLPIVDSRSLDSMRRLIWLVDQLYKENVKLWVVGQAPLQECVKVPEKPVYDQQFALQRCRSRLEQMQSKQYLQRKATSQT